MTITRGPSDGTTVSVNGIKKTKQNILKGVLEGFQQKVDSRMDQTEGMMNAMRAVMLDFLWVDNRAFGAHRAFVLCKFGRITHAD